MQASKFNAFVRDKPDSGYEKEETFTGMRKIDLNELRNILSAARIHNEKLGGKIASRNSIGIEWSKTSA